MDGKKTVTEIGLKQPEIPSPAILATPDDQFRAFFSFVLAIAAGILYAHLPQREPLERLAHFWAVVHGDQHLALDRPGLLKIHIVPPQSNQLRISVCKVAIGKTIIEERKKIEV